MSVYDTSTIGVTDNKIVFNATTFPVYRVVSRAPQQRQLRSLDISIPYESGITDFETLEGNSAYIITGVMYPGSTTDYDNGLAALRKLSSLDIEQADNSADHGYVPYVFTETSQNKQVFLKVLYVDVPESTRKGLVQPFRLVCKIKDPTIFSSVTAVASTQGSNPTIVTGSSNFPFGFPILWSASTYSVSSVANNTGDLPGYPISIKVYGPINTPTITNALTGEFITVNTNVATNSILTIAYDKDTLTADVDGVSVLSNVTSASTYFKLKPGANNITLTGTTFGSGAYVVVTYYQGYWPLS
jgi:hypothetical protein